MNKLISLGSAVLALSIVPLASAVSIVGEVHVTQFGGTAAVNTTANTVTFAPTAPAQNAQVSFTTGSWTGLLGTPVSYANFTYSPLSVAAIPTWDAGTIWRADSNTYFVLTSIFSVQEGVGLVLEGNGIAYHDAFEPTAGLWSFSADASGNAFSFSSTVVTAPEGGTTISLLGFALAGFALLRRKLRS